MIVSLVRVVVSLLLLAAAEANDEAAASSVAVRRPSSGKAVSLRGSTEKTTPIRTHSLYSPYVDSDLQNRWFDFHGSAIVNTNKHIRLTQDRSSQSGWLWSRLPLAPNAFEVEFEFKVDGKSNSLFGDGFAVWLTKARAGSGPVFGSTDNWEGLGIFFDTYANSRHTYAFPRIYGIMNDGTKSYNAAGDGEGQEVGSCSIDFRRTDITTKARITYFKGQFTELAIHHTKWDQWTTCFTIENADLPANPFLGFSAHTGDVSDAHDIISISTSNVVYHPPTARSEAASNRPSSSSSLSKISSFLSITFSYLRGLVKWVVLLGVITAAVISFRKWKTAKDSKRF